MILVDVKAIAINDEPVASEVIKSIPGNKSKMIELSSFLLNLKYKLK